MQTPLTEVRKTHSATQCEVFNEDALGRKIYIIFHNDTPSFGSERLSPSYIADMYTTNQDSSLTHLHRWVMAF